jgi:RNA polymerase sigma factor (sigma-70 family)
MMNDNVETTVFDKLIKDCIKNNRKAQKKLYELLYKPMYNLSLYMVKNATDAEDLMQETFISAYKNLNTYKNHVRFDYWVKRIAINKCIDFLRSKKQATFIEEENVLNFIKTEDLVIETDENRQGLIRLIKNNVLNLPDGYRIILTLYYFEGYDHQEIAEILNIKESTSRSQLNRAIVKLKSLIENSYEVQPK